MTLVLIAAILLLVDFLLAGGAMTMTGMTTVASAVAHPHAALALLLLDATLVLDLSGGSP